MMGDIYLTKEGIEKIKEELSYLKNVKRKAVIERIKEARAYGDLAENSEYDDAKEEQAFIEGRIQELEEMLKKAKIIQNNKKDKVALGSRVKVKRGGTELVYYIVGKSESDPASFKISSESPLGKALLGKKRGDKVEVETPSGKVGYEILEIG